MTSSNISRGRGWARFYIAHFVPVIGFAMLLLSASASAYAADAPVELFAKSQIQSGLVILENTSLSPREREAQLRSFFLTLLDTRRIAMGELARLKQTTRSSDADSFCDAYGHYIVERYASIINTHPGLMLSVAHSENVGNSDYLVTTSLVDPTTGPGGEAHIDVRVLEENGKFFIVDAWFKGISMIQTVHEELQTLPAYQSGDVARLAAQIREMTEHVQASAGKV